jgi:hypothetical protein
VFEHPDRPDLNHEEDASWIKVSRPPEPEEPMPPIRRDSDELATLHERQRLRRPNQYHGWALLASVVLAAVIIIALYFAISAKGGL